MGFLIHAVSSFAFSWSCLTFSFGPLKSAFAGWRFRVISLLLLVLPFLLCPADCFSFSFVPLRGFILRRPCGALSSGGPAGLYPPEALRGLSPADGFVSCGLLCACGAFSFLCGETPRPL